MSKKNKIALSVWAGVCALTLAGTSVGAWYATTWDRALGKYFGSIGETQVSSDELIEEQKQLELEIVDEGCVLLQNDDAALPLSSGNKVSVFGQTAQMWMTKEKITNTKDTVFLESLEKCGIEINGALRKFYKQTKHTKWGNGANLGDGGIAGNWAIDEVPQSEYTEEVKNSYKEYSDAAIVVFTRGGSEGGDLPRYMGRYGGSDDEHYLQLNQDERDLLAAIKEANCFKKTIVVLHTCNAMQMDFATREEYGIDSVLWVSGTGQDGVEEMGKIITGEINPSAKNINTYVYDNFSAPAMQNFGDYRYTYGGELIEDTTTTATKGGSYSYLNYGEGIYVGYKYYETRYADVVSGVSNVGNYDYAETVYAPFGYGLSYTQFEWSDFKATVPNENGDITVSVNVKNVGEVAGKEVVQFYYQAPYTVGGIEKSAINLVDFEKTSLLKTGASETVEATFNIRDFASYDSEKEQAYVLDGGAYYVTAASDAHSALNNVLASCGYSVKDGMTEDGDNAFVSKINLDYTAYKTAPSGNEYSNLFEDCELSDATYLSRSNWSVMDSFNLNALTGGLSYAQGTKNIGTSSGSGKFHSDTMNNAGTVGVSEISEENLAKLKAVGWDASGNPKGMNDSSWQAVTYSSGGTLTCNDMVGVDYGDEKWFELVCQMSLAEQKDIVGRAGWGTDAVDSVGKPQQSYLDGPQGMIDYISGGKGYQFTDQNMLGATWNKELARREGDLVSAEFAMKGASVWWSPALNIHRTAFSGRNFEYFSEDGVHSGILGAIEAKAGRDNGVIPQLKHFFLNDQETNRGANGRLATFATEQSIREIYTKAFEEAIVEGYAGGVMATMSRIGYVPSPLSYATMTGLLRNEWGMKGAVITDAQSLTSIEAEQALAAGCDMVCSTSATTFLETTLNSAGGKYMLANAAKNVLYVAVNSVAIDGSYSQGYPVYKLLIIALYVIVITYLAYGTVEVLLKIYPEQKKLSPKGIKLMRITLWSIGGAILTVLLVMFFAVWLEDLIFAFQTI